MVTAPPMGLCSCDSYEPASLDRAFDLSADFAGFPGIAGARILVKPNLLNASPPEKAVTTHPAFLAAAIRFLRRRGAGRILVGDSPAWQGSIGAAKTAGLYDAAAAGGAEWIEFLPGAPRPSRGGTLVKSFILAKAVEECDLIVNLPKLKNHRLMLYTGAVKNFFGLVPGIGKSGYHLRFPDKRSFGTMLVDLLGALPDSFSFMDGIVAMEGEGPGNGTPYHLGLVFASKSPASLDWIASQSIGYDPKKIPYLADAMGRVTGDAAVGGDGVGTGPERLEDRKVRDFRLLPYGGGTSTSGNLPGFVKPFVRIATIDRPVFNRSKCIGCLACAKICPSGALEMSKTLKNQILIDDAACITCYCCHEVCPAGAITIGKVVHRIHRRRNAG